MIRLLTEHDVARALAEVDLVALMRDALRAYSAGEVVQPTRAVVPIDRAAAFFGAMPAFVPGRDALGAKLVSVFTRNRARGLPSHAAAILLFDADTGGLTALLDGRFITEMRTAAVSAVAAEALAPAAVRRLAVFGCGVQAGSHLRVMVPRLPALEAVTVWSPFDDREPFAAALGAELPVPVLAAASAGQAARDADIVILVTSSTTPVLDEAWVRPGALVIAVGACRPTHREIDPELVARGRVFVDSREAALVESGDIVCGIAEGRFGAGHLCGELGDVLLGRVAARASADDRVIFKSLGLAVEDVTVADVAYRRAVEQGLGTTWDF